MLRLTKRTTNEIGQRIFFMVLFLLTLATSESNSYISKALCYQQYLRYLQPKVESRDTSGYPGFRCFLDSCSFDQKYFFFDSLKAILIDSLKSTWKMEYLMPVVIEPFFEAFWRPYFLRDDAFFKFAFRQCEKLAPGADPVTFDFYYSMQYLTIMNISDQQWILDIHPDSNICLRNNLGFVDSLATLILTDQSLSKYYRRNFAGMDKYNDAKKLNCAGFSLRIDSTFKGRRLNDIVSFDSSFIAVADDTGLIAISIDAGYHWRTSAPFTTNKIDAVGFLTKSKGYCIENNMTLWTTKNSGATWQQTSLGQAMYQDLIVFDSTRLLLLDSFNGNVWSDDGGTTWTKTSIPFNDFTSVIAPNCAYGLSFRQVRKSTNGGAAWNDICLLDSSFHPGVMTFIDERTGLIGGVLGETGISVDGGIHWRKFILPTVENVVGFFHMADESIFALTDRFSVFSTKDNGSTWAPEKVCFPTFLLSATQMGKRRSVWAGNTGLLFFCEAPVVTDVAGPKYKKPMISRSSRFGVKTSYSLDGRYVAARNGAPGVRLTGGSAHYTKTVLVR
jgi:photosystem II stability/assembly factor-like uncharacterized protein